MSPLKKVAASLFGLLAVIAVAVIALWQIDTRSRTSPEQPLATSSTAERGAYLARVGNCAGCHTVRGGKPYAGGLAIDTPFGAVYASNLTPDAATGIGSWTRTDFWHAMHHGQSKNGRLLYPAFPYTSYTLITREDSDALFTYRACPASISPIRRIRCVFRTTRKRHWPYGVLCISSLAATKQISQRLHNSIAVRIWSIASAIAVPVMPREMRWALLRA